MQVISTRNDNVEIKLTAALKKGLADDGGLYIPKIFPNVDLTTFSSDDDYVTFAEKLLRYFFSDESLSKKLNMICQRAFNFSVPLKKINSDTYILELFHGPTSSFKDFGARFLAECLNCLSSKTEKATILVATSGDTGSAVASAFHNKPHANVIVLFPEGKISKRQEQQLSCWGDNVLAVSVKGTFDDCQRLVKTAYKEFKQFYLSTANSINLGRLLPQMVYYAYHAWHFTLQHQEMPGFVVPSGNLGNVTASYWAQKIGFPIREIVIATNANQVLPDYMQTGKFTPRASIETLANAMDVGNPSNFERLQHLFKDFATAKKHIQVMSVNDKDIEATIAELYQKYNEVICPHTATAFFMRRELSTKPWIIVATAEAAKFETIIEPIIKKKVPVSKHLMKLLDKETHVLEITADLESLATVFEVFSV